VCNFSKSVHSPQENIYKTGGLSSLIKQVTQGYLLAARSTLFTKHLAVELTRASLTQTHPSPGRTPAGRLFVVVARSPGCSPAILFVLERATSLSNLLVAGRRCVYGEIVPT
jgi:hypothetical protein